MKKAKLHNIVENQSDWVVVGRFGRPHGIKGFITVHPFNDERDSILSYTDWHVFLDKKWQAIKLVAVESHNKVLTVQVEHYPERELVAKLTNAEIAVHKDQLARLEPGEYYWHQLIGMKVVNQSGELFGTVVEMIATGSNDVLVVQGEKKHLIPYLPGQYVLNIDDSQQTITVDWDMEF
jgi:16S rRNA processing protein RimM